MIRSARFAPAVALLVCLLAEAPARAALVTDVADAADKDNPIDLNLELRWTRTQHRAKVTREFFDSEKSQTLNVTELYYQRWTHVMDMNIALGLYHDLEIHGNIPYGVTDEQYWDYGRVNNVYVGPSSTLQNNHYNTDGSCLNQACSQTRPIVASPGRVFRGGFMDPSVGVAWGIFNGERDDKLPEKMFPWKQRTANWVLGFDYTMPIIDPMDPTSATPAAQAAQDSSKVFPLGLGTHRFDWWMAMSKRIGIVDPFLKIHYTLPVAANNAYDNCAVAGGDTTNSVMSSVGKKLCNPNDPFDPDHYWVGKTTLQYPHVGGMTVGAEFIPVEDKVQELRFAIGVQIKADFVSKGRTYTELSDALQKLTYADQYFVADARLTFDLRFSKWVHWVSFMSIGTNTPHYITSETVGKDRFGDKPGTPADGVVLIGSAEMNPNYDFRLDQPGRRLRVTEVSVFGLSSMLAVNF